MPVLYITNNILFVVKIVKDEGKSKCKTNIFDKPRADSNLFGLCRGEKRCMDMKFHDLIMPNRIGAYSRIKVYF